MAEEYIEREAVCYQLAKQATIDGQPRAIRRAAKIVADFPAADVVPVRHGRWELGGMFRDIGRCSNCHYIFPANTAMTKFHYCPNCGAKMDKDGDGE